MSLQDEITARSSKIFRESYQMSIGELMNLYRDGEKGIEIAKQLDGHLDLIHVSAGSHEVWDVFTVTHPDMFLPDGVNVKEVSGLLLQFDEQRSVCVRDQPRHRSRD